MATTLHLADIPDIPGSPELPTIELRPYGTGLSPSGDAEAFRTLNEWWIAGFVMSLVNIAILVTVGGVWWTMLGYL